MNATVLPPTASEPLSTAPETPHGKRQLFAQVGVLLALTFVAVVTGVAFKEQLDNFVPESVSFPSVFNHKPSGTSGALELVNKAGLKGRDWVMPYRKLFTVRGALVIIAPSESLADYEAEQVLEWVATGNDLIYLDDFSFHSGQEILTKIGLSARDGKSIKESVIAVKPDSAPEFKHLDHLTISADNRLSGTPPLISDSSGTLFADIKYGKGRVLIGTAPTFIANRRLGDQLSWANFQYFINRLSEAKGEVWFDERCHGFSTNANVLFFLARGPLGLVVAQLALALVVGVASAAQRFGATAPLNTRRKISNLEFIYGLANTYSRAKANTASLEIIGQTLRSALCKTLMVSPHDSTEQVLAALEASTQLSADLKEETAGFLRDYEKALAMPHLTDSEFKAMIIRCDKIGDKLSKTVLQKTQPAGSSSGSNNGITDDRNS